MKRRVLELLRVSTRGQGGDDRGGLPAQRAANRRTAQQYGLEIVGSVELVDVSGAAILFEPAMQRLLREIARPDIAGVVCREFSRLMRPNNYADYKILERFVQTHSLLFLPEGPLDFGDKMGRIVGTMQGLISGLELDTIRERMMSGKEALRRQGCWVGGSGCLPYGVAYDRETRRFSYRPEAVPKITEVFRRFLAGEQNYNLLSEMLGVSRGTAKNILTNPIYAGWLVYDQRRNPEPEGKYGMDAAGEPRFNRSGKLIRDRRKIQRAESEVIRKKVMEGLVSERDFQAVQRIVARKATISLKERRLVGQFLYNGFLWCSKCGARIHTFRNQRDRYYYACSGKKHRNGNGGSRCPHTGYMNRDKLEPILDRMVSSTLSDIRLLSAIADEGRRRAEAGNGKREATRLRGLLTALDGKRERILEAFLDGLMNKDSRNTRLVAVDTERAKTQATLDQVAPDRPEFDPAHLAEMFRPFTHWESMTRDGKRRMLTALSPRFQVADYYVAAVDIDMGSRSKTEPSPSRAPPCRSPSRRALCWQRR